MLDNVTLAISIVGGIALASGVLILIGAVAMTKFQRVYEAAILRTLGASTRLLGDHAGARVYSALGLLAGLVGALGALALSWAVCRFVFEIEWRPAPLLLAAGALLTMALVATIGVLASVDVLRKKPLATLRARSERSSRAAAGRRPGGRIAAFQAAGRILLRLTFAK